MPVAEVFLGASLAVLFEKLASRELRDFARQEGIHSQLQKLSETLETIKTVLDDAEKKQIWDSGVKTWLDKLKDLAYDMEDVLDEFATKSSCRMLKAQSQASTSKAQSFIQKVSSLKKGVAPFKFKMQSKIKEINRRLQLICERKAQLGLQGAVGEACTKVWQRPLETTSYMFDPHVYGRDEDKRKIIQLLLMDERSNNKVDVIPICGLPGTGKTTLAQHVFNNEVVQQHFNLKAWVCVSDDFDVKTITKAILESFSSQAPDLSELNQLQAKLNQTLAGKQFLLVLDDVWNEKYDEWDRLRAPFGAGARGSKIIVTTRDDRVASMMRTVETHFLKLLSDDDCWSVFVQHAFENGNINVDANLEMTSLRKKVVKKCKGLPLAAKSLSGLLRNKLDVQEWEDILSNEIWDLFNENDVIPAALRLSYYHLPTHLKPCFSYCSVLPKDYEFREREIVLLWMAEGIIPRGEKLMEDLGAEYFRELSARSFFQRSDGDGSQFVMHDLVNDLAQFVAGKTCFKLEGDKKYEIFQKARYFSYMCGDYDSQKKFEALEEAKYLRTFLPYGTSYPPFYLTNYLLLNLLPKLRYLRVLSLRDYSVNELPSGIGDLKHLRYLDLSRTPIRRLPESVSMLFNLQTMLLRACKELRRLPTKMEKLINLRHLDLTGDSKLEGMPLRMGALTSLQTLSNFIVGKGTGFGIEQLRNLSYLQGTLSISRLENVIDVRDAREANLINLQRLNVLMLNWGNNSSQNLEVEQDILTELRPHQKLEELCIKFYGGRGFPLWIGDPSFSNTSVLTLEDCGKCTSLPPLGKLAALKILSINRMAEVKSVGPEFYGVCCSKSFQSLESLKFSGMSKWEDWHHVEGGLPRLRELSVEDCPKLMGQVPDNLPTLERLDIDDCEELVVSLSSLPSLCNLTIKRCDKLVTTEAVDLSSLTSLTTSNIREVDVCEDGALRIMAAHQLSSLNSLCVRRIPKLMFLPEVFIQELTKLEKLQIHSCQQLTSLWQKELQQRLNSLRRLEINECPQLVSLAEEEEEEKQQWLPYALEYLVLEGCQKLKKLPRGLHNLTFLRELSLEDCSSMISLPETGLPPALKELRISGCRALKSLLERTMRNDNSNSCLEYLYIARCPSLTCLSTRDALPTSLRRLGIYHCKKLELITEQGMPPDSSLEHIWIWDCPNLQALPDGLHALRFLNHFSIRGCGNLASLPRGGLPLTSLRQLQLHGCEKLRELPSRMCNLTSLEHLHIEDCPGTTSFLEGDFPTKLKFLRFNSSEIGKASECGLHRLSSLKQLHISGQCSGLVSFPNEDDNVGVLLPSSVTDLNIGGFPNLKKLSSKAFRNLSSLEKLRVYHCPKLTSIPEELLPPSLLRLQVNDCPLLKQQLMKGKGRLWPKIAYIPRVEIDWRSIFETDEE